MRGGHASHARSEERAGVGDVRPTHALRRAGACHLPRRGRLLARRPVRAVVWLDTLEGGPGYRIKKLRYEALPGLWVPALLYEPETLEGKVPAVLNVNGHDSKGKSADYKQIRCINQAKRGMLALNIEWLGMGQLHDATTTATT